MEVPHLSCKHLLFYLPIDTFIQQIFNEHLSYVALAHMIGIEDTWFKKLPDMVPTFMELSLVGETDMVQTNENVYMYRW